MKQLFVNSKIHMSNISKKKPSERKALASGRIIVGAKAFHQIVNNKLPKGDIIPISEVAGITGAKKTSELLPLCHPIDISAVWVEIIPNEESFSFDTYVLAVTTSKTGIEMEALSGVNACLLNIYDLTKPIEPNLLITDIRLLAKSGGKKGLWTNPQGLPKIAQNWIDNEFNSNIKPLKNIKISLITLSDRASQGIYQDTSGESASSILNNLGATIVAQDLIADDATQLQQIIKQHLSLKPDVIFTLGGTGLSPQDITVETLTPLFNKQASGLAQMMKHESAKLYTDKAWLSNSIAGVIEQSLVITLPGSEKAVRENLEIYKNILPHAINMKNGGSKHD